MQVVHARQRSVLLSRSSNFMVVGGGHHSLGEVPCRHQAPLPCLMPQMKSIGRVYF